MDGSNKLVIFEYNYHATVGYVYRFFVVSNDSEQAPDKDESILDLESIENTSVKTEGNNIYISCISGDVYKKENSVNIEGASYKIEITGVCENN
ncbi:hypothetical protein [Zooshikella ganghwensis]|uniref:Uncharacterized protein n=1 Tax=Zooshikella ganghwensis TaxID=202772 RepID=A0A4P9VDX7_9GAMM|nr:hypothetical protein [Zooshikella ganghwensis]RDH41265.1 hypothetical protein B9G39_29605 [Zooshikella ganghwensis]